MGDWLTVARLSMYFNVYDSAMNREELKKSYEDDVRYFKRQYESLIKAYEYEWNENFHEYRERIKRDLHREFSEEITDDNVFEYIKKRIIKNIKSGWQWEKLLEKRTQLQSKKQET